MTESIRPKDHAEAVALFRAQVIGPLTARDLGHGELAEELRALSERRFRPPWLDHSRTYAPATLERWYYAYRAGGLEALKPARRSDRGYAQALTEEQRTLVLEIAQERPEVSVSVLLRTLVADGRLGEGEVSEPTIRRLLLDAGLSRQARRQLSRGARRRWQAEAPDALWHADVCHGRNLSIDGRSIPVRVHALLDDASRFIVGIRAFSTEREVDMLELMVQALRQSGPPRTLYLGRVGARRGDRRWRGVAVADRFRQCRCLSPPHSAVSGRRSSNRACGSPAHGSHLTHQTFALGEPHAGGRGW